MPFSRYRDSFALRKIAQIAIHVGSSLMIDGPKRFKVLTEAEEDRFPRKTFLLSMLRYVNDGLFHQVM